MSDNNGYLTREQLLRQDVRRYADVTLPNVGKCRIRSMTERESANLEAKAVDRKGNISIANAKKARARTVAFCVVDGTGERLFSDDDIDALQAIDAGIINTIYDECARHCGVDGIEATEKAEKN